MCVCVCVCVCVQYESIAEQMQRMGRKKAEGYSHPLSQGMYMYINSDHSLNAQSIININDYVHACTMVILWL